MIQNIIDLLKTLHIMNFNCSFRYSKIIASKKTIHILVQCEIACENYNTRAFHDHKYQ